MTNNNIKVGIIQQTYSSDTEKNIKKICQNIELEVKEGAELIVLSELHNNLYFCLTEDVNNFNLAENIPGKSTSIYSAIAKKYGIILVCSLFERRAAGVYHNTAVVFEKDGSIAGKYRKMHIPDDPGFYEKFYFTPGDLGFEPINTSIGKLGVLICWDQWFPEAARIMALKDAEILIYPTAIGWDMRDDAKERKRQKDSWITIQRAHAISNGIPVISVNRVGFEPEQNNSDVGIQFWGNSFICGTQGEILYEAPDNTEVNKVLEIDLNRKEEVRRIWPFFRDRRIEEYEELNKRYLI